MNKGINNKAGGETAGQSKNDSECNRENIWIK